MEIEDDKIKDIKITGDFFMYPEEALTLLESALTGAEADEGVVREKVNEFYAKTGVQTPMIAPGDFVKAISKALSGSA
ncbi:TPA: lipoate--protein ligase family protein [Candidatus Bathyarchaeota archaeon]|nr:lipoate--protein ligase family protein [Candidatus Bathyarchaeota archaeon]